MGSLEDEYIELYRAASQREIDVNALEQMNAELRSALHRLIAVCEPPIADDVYIGLLPINKINAWVRTRSSGYLFVVNHGWIPLALGTGLLLGAILPFSFRGQVLAPDIDVAPARTRFHEMLIAYVKYPRMTFDGSFVRPNPRQEFGALVCTSLIWFVIAHELAHVVCGHLNKDHVEQLQIGTSETQSYVLSCQDEMEADKEAIRMLMRLHQDNVPVDTTFLGPLVFFELLEAISETASHLGIRQQQSDHPPSKARRSAIIHDNYSPGQLPETPFLDCVVETIGELRKRL
jgi:hypothetical protein